MDRTALAALAVEALDAWHGDCSAPDCPGCASDRALSAMTGQSPVKMWTETEIEALLSDLSEVA